MQTSTPPQRLTPLWAKFGPPVFAAILALAAFPPFNLSLLVFVALVPWLRYLRTCTPREAWTSGYVFGLVYSVGQLLWLGQFVFNWTDSILIGILPMLIVCPLMALYFGLAGVWMRLAMAKGWLWLVPLIWAGIEVARSYVPTFAFPWGVLALPLWPYTPFIQHAYFGTIYLVGAWCVLISLIIALVMDGEPLAAVRPKIAVALALLVLSLLRLGNPVETRNMVVTLAQPGVDMAFGDQATEFDHLRQVFNPILDAASINGTELVVMPEAVAAAANSVPRTPFSTQGAPPIVFGAQRGTRPMFQSYFTFESGIFAYADKTRLVIFGEFVPFRDFLPYPESFRLPAGDLVPGRDGVRSLDVAGIRVGGLLCFEALFPDLAYRHIRNGSQLLAIMSIDDWFMGTSAPEQLRAGSVWRAVENGTPVVRAASLGYTLATDGFGRILVQAPLKKPVGVRVEVPVPTRPAGFPGSPVFPILALLSPLCLLLPSRSRKTQGAEAGEGQKKAKK